MGTKLCMNRRRTKMRLDHVIRLATMLTLALAFLGFSSGPIHLPALADSPVWRDDFDVAGLDPAWYWVDEDPSRWSLTEGFLRIYAAPGPTGSQNLLLRDAAPGNLAIETRVLFEPTADFQFAGLVVYQDEDDYLQFGRAYCDIGACPGNALYFDQIRGGEWVGGNWATVVDNTQEAFLRLEVQGETATAYYSQDGAEWMQIGEHAISGFSVNSVGLTASQNGAAEDIAADFDFFVLELLPSPGAWFTAFPELEAVEGWDWPLDAVVHLTIEDPATELSPDLEREETVILAPWGSGQHWVWFGFADAYNLKPGDVVTLSDGVTTRTHVVRNLAVTAVDEIADTVGGTADEGALVNVWPHGEDWAIQHETAEDGTWLAEFGKVEFDLEVGTAGRADIRDDEGNATAVDWWVPNQWFTAFPEWEAVEGWDWPLDAVVHLTIEDPATELSPDLEREETVILTPWGSGEHWVWFSFADAYNLKPGDVVTLSDGVTTRTHVVRNLAVTAVDEIADTVAGTAGEGALVNVWPHGEDWAIQHETADEVGAWLANFAGVEFNLVPETVGRADIRDDEGNATAVDWWVPNPWLTAFPEWEAVEGWDWPLDAVVHLTIEDLATELSPDLERDEMVILTPWGSGEHWVWFDFADAYNLKPGDVVTLSDGVTTRTHVVRNLAVTAVDVVADTVAGTAGKGALVNVWPHGEDWAIQHETAEDGSWLANFAGVEFDLKVGTAGRADIRDDEGNATAVDWYAAPPEGWHDYNEGDVPSFACNAGGWAVDLDDPYEHVTVRVLVDGVLVLDEITADVYREDLDAAWQEGIGGCPGGTCAFDVDLWDTVAHYETHEITVEAQDLQSEEWFPLNATPKMLTCRTYDIYTFNTLTGQTRPITALTETDEYNPSWSPDGRKIAHDVWSWSEGWHNVYVTEVQTGVSTPLDGAQDGSNDAAWSPNGQWIAFDRYAADPSIYIVPATGGARRLVREDAISAAWAPNGQRIAFHQPSDGSIRSVRVDGGGVTLIVHQGTHPAWSPNGQWVSYERDGDVWKVPVNLQGMPLGEPIQMTSDDDWEGRTTWSADSQTIAFHAEYNGETDIWTIPADGGTATWLTGAPGFGDYDPAYSNDGRYVAYAGFAPLPAAPLPAARRWVAVYTFDVPAGTWTEGVHPYHFEFEWSAPEPGAFTGQEGEFIVSSEASLYDGQVLLRGRAELHRVVQPGGPACEPVDAVHPLQPTRFLVGWLTDYEMTHAEALSHFDDLVARVVWDDGLSAELVRHEIRPFISADTQSQYVCTFTMRK